MTENASPNHHVAGRRRTRALTLGAAVLALASGALVDAQPRDAGPRDADTAPPTPTAPSAATARTATPAQPVTPAQPATSAQPAPAVSPWVGTWLFHSPNHSSYQATEYRIRADGSFQLSAAVDTVGAGAELARGRRLIRGFVFGRRICWLGTRWTLAGRPERIRVDGLCSDGRHRPIEFDLAPNTASSPWPRASLDHVTVGGRRGYRIAHGFEVEVVRCGADPEQPCERIAYHFERGHARRFGPEDFDAEGRFVQRPPAPTP